LEANGKKSQYEDKAVLMTLQVGDKIFAETKTCQKDNESFSGLGIWFQRQGSMLFCIRRHTD
jgi:hypothetical protein